MSNKKQKQAFKKIGQGLKETFIEMSDSLAGWIDDTGDLFYGQQRQTTKTSVTKPKTTTTSRHRSSSTPSKTNKKS